jgi:Outer membrane cobalamin receptor protein
MRHASFDRISLVVGSLAILSACASGTPNRHMDNASDHGDAVIDGDQIDAQHAANAWELLRQLVPRYTYTEDRGGRASMISARRGRSSISIASSESPIVMVDGARLSSLELLQDMPTIAIDRIELFDGPRGTRTQGTNASAGVIIIHTRSGS